jgi:hypothetical protein
VRIEQTFTVASPPEAVFDYITDPANLRGWQTSKTRVEALSEGPRRQVPGARVDQAARSQGVRAGRRVQRVRPPVHIVEGPQPIDGMWALTATDAGTRVDFSAEGPLRGLMRFLEPIAKRAMGRQFAKYHELLRRNVEGRSPNDRR